MPSFFAPAAPFAVSLPIWGGLERLRLGTARSAGSARIAILCALLSLTCLSFVTTEVIRPSLPSAALKRICAFWTASDLIAIAVVEVSCYEISEPYLTDWEPEAEPPPYDIPRAVSIVAATIRRDGDDGR